ncbi:MAG TPA: PAS domain-containing protein [Methylophilaceae bacterium]|nr:PAS domain-containing protein [Methylophilaceae bacterium]HQR60879.1 PAS domain-containing protein [Methylophilaceae bacterium]
MNEPTENMAVLMLNDNGMIYGCNKACEKLFGYLSGEIIWKHISMLLPQLAGIALMSGQQINPRLHFLTHIGHQFEVVGLGGIHFASQLFINEVENLGQHYLRLIISPA